MLDSPDTPRTCAHCGYITEHITSGRCPECGTSVTDGRAPRPEPFVALVVVTMLNCTAGWLSLAFPLGGEPTQEPIIMTTWLVSAILCGTWILIDFGRGGSSLAKSEVAVLALSALQLVMQPILLF